MIKEKDWKFIVVLLCVLFLFVTVAWILKKYAFVDLFFDQLIWLSAWSILFSFFIIWHVFSGRCTRRWSRMLMGALLIVSGVMISAGLGMTEQSLLEWKGHMPVSDDWYVPLMLLIEGVQALREVGTIGIAAIGASIVASVSLETSSGSKYS